MALESLVPVVGLGVIVAATALVHWDARRVDVGRPRLWAAIVAASGTIGLALYLLVSTVPIPGLLVIVLFGPAFYLFERDDTIHGDEPADPHVLADETNVDRSATDAGDTSNAREE